MGNVFELEVWGDYACFTRPEMKVERVSYDVPTPSSVRAVFESIYWKPAIVWEPLSVEVLAPIRFLSFRRNEVGSVVSMGNVKTAMTRGSGMLGIYIEEERQQRAALMLRDVRYRIKARMVVQSNTSDHSPAAKHYEIFERRAQKGQCFNQPYLGTRECSCAFSPLRSDAVAIGESRDLGFMLYDMDFADPADPTPLWFRATLEEGTVRFPAKTEVLR
ncbi:MAG: type I-C CRISPR-associated protein Cas5 [Campylobacterales bacterium]|nr:type I-C CRISPR-associated protein Cas5 [Campylobacterales bacterium]